MKILGIESATAICATAMINDGSVLSKAIMNQPRVHSEKMIRLIAQTLMEADCALSDLDGIAVSIGPGSFTGLRIGLSVAKGLAYSQDKPLIAVPTLEAMAWTAAHELDSKLDTMILALIDARRDEVYAACYRMRAGGLVRIMDACSMTLEDLQLNIPGSEHVVLTGDASEKFLRYLDRQHKEDLERFSKIPLRSNRCDAVSVGLLGEKKLSKSEISDVSSLEPLYVKEFFTMIKSQHTQV